MKYSHTAIEKKWIKFWDADHSFETDLNSISDDCPKFYCLDMFPYPSGQGLHVGHPLGYTATDVISRFKKMQGFHVFHPIGFDAFGLPAEQYALTTGHSPQAFTNHNINHFRHQLKRLGLMYDYSKEVNTSDPNYYKGTQQIFLLLYKRGLVELQNVDVNWCETLQTVLANEEIVEEGKQMFSERGHFLVEKKPMQQWVLKITKYADRLLEGLKTLEWPSSVKQLQFNWIGQQKGYGVNCKIAGREQKVEIFTTQLDMINDFDFVALHPRSACIKTLGLQNNAHLKAFNVKYKWQSDSDKTNVAEEKFGFFTNHYLIHPLSKKQLPIWITNFVVKRNQQAEEFCATRFSKMHYLFASKYQIIAIDQPFQVYKKKARCLALAKDVFQQLQSKKVIRTMTVYHLKDWVFSRQRYWGEPIPLLYDQSHQVIPLSNKDLPLLLPEMKALDSTICADKPLDKAVAWKKVILNQQTYWRETNVMPQWAGSCWYYLAYLLRLPDNQYLDLFSLQAQKVINRWLPVDIYIGGQEHAVLHLLYARFWHMVLYDAGILNVREPFLKLVNQGMVQGSDGQKMSKSRGNVISVDAVVESHGGDALRLTELFMGPITDSKFWSVATLDAMRKWLDKVYVIATTYRLTDYVPLQKDERYVHQTIKSLTIKVEKLLFNTALSDLMVLLEQFRVAHDHTINKNHFVIFLKMLSLFAPFLSQELYSLLGYQDLIMNQPWPKYDARFLVPSVIALPVQVNGKLKKVLQMPLNYTQSDIFAKLEKDKHFQAVVKNHRKIVFVKDKIINFIVEDTC